MTIENPADASGDGQPSDRLLDAALTVIADQGWREATMGEIALRAGVSLADLYALFPSRMHLLAALVARTDRRVLAAPAADAAESPRDRLFDVLMRRFDVLQPHKEAYARLMRELPLDPPAMAALLLRLRRAMRWMVEAAGLSPSGPAGYLRSRGLALIYLRAVRTWVTDDSPDLARTMAALDRDLRRADAVVQALPGFPRAAAPPSPPPAPPRDDEPLSLDGIPD